MNAPSRGVERMGQYIEPAEYHTLDTAEDHCLRSFNNNQNKAEIIREDGKCHQQRVDASFQPNA